MNKEMIIRVPYQFHGITVIVPQQREVELIVINLGSFLPKNILEVTKDFTLIRHIANIAVLNKKEYEYGKLVPVTLFDPPIEIRVAYNFLDVMQSDCKPSLLKLAFWNGSKWVILSDPNHDYLILPPETAHVAEAKIWTWSEDPPLAWGK